RFESWISGERERRQVEQPRAHHAAAPPELRNLRELEVVPLVLGQRARRRVAHDVETFGVGLHQAVLDAVVNHLHEMTGARRTAVEESFMRGRLRRIETV